MILDEKIEQKVYVNQQNFVSDILYNYRLNQHSFHLSHELLMYTYIHTHTHTHIYIYIYTNILTMAIFFSQALGHLISFLCSLVNCIYFGPETIRLVHIRAQRVKFLGIEDGVGPVSPKLVKHDETYREIKSKFIRYHAACSLINVICFGACGVSMWCLACKQLST